METATFAAGCFWGVEEAFRTLPGVKQTRVGYTGGTVENPFYEMVCGGRTSPEQEKAVRETIERLPEERAYTQPIATQVVPAVTFYPAEEYHQQYFAKRGLVGCHV
ncbi:MAG: peptide-methionine (S)-S-oxide reductase [Limibacillus sp.]